MSFLENLGLSAASNSFQALGSWISGNQQKKENQKNREFAEHMYDKQFANSIKMWNMQNDYDLPKNQLERLKMAGLNPDLMYSGVGVSPSPNLQNPSAGSPSTMPLTPYSIDPISKAKEYEMMDAQIKNLKSDSNKKDSETNLNVIDAITRGDFNNITIENMAATRDYTREQQKLAIGMLSQINQGIQESKARIEQIKAYTKNLDEDTIFKQIHNLYASKEFEAAIAETWSQVKSNNASANASNSVAYRNYEDVKIAYQRLAIDTMLANSNVKVNNALCEKYGFDNRLTQAQEGYYESQKGYYKSLKDSNDWDLSMHKKWDDTEHELKQKQMVVGVVKGFADACWAVVGK